MMRGRFITFEGGEGAGKSTQIRTLAERLGTSGLKTVTTREPGGSPGAEIIRHLVLSGVGKLLGSDAEALLFAAARDDHVKNLIEPALASGAWVLSDRFIDSTRVYQGKLGAVDPKLIRALEHVTIGDLLPDLTIILDIPVDIGLSRAQARRGDAAADRFESENADYHQRLREAYLAAARDEPQRCVVVDANGSLDEVAARVWSAVSQRLTLPSASSVNATELLAKAIGKGSIGESASGSSGTSAAKPELAKQS